MIQQPCIAFLVGDDFAVVTRSFPSVVALYDGFIVVVQHPAALPVHIGSCQFLGASHHGVVGAFGSFAAGAYAGKQVIVSLPLVYHCPFEGCSCHLCQMGGILYPLAVLGESAHIQSSEASPDEIFLAFVFHVAGVDAVLHTYLCAAEHLAAVGEFCGRGAFRHTQSGAGLVAPVGRCIVDQIFLSHPAHVQSPQAEAHGVHLTFLVGTYGVVPCGSL